MNVCFLNPGSSTEPFFGKMAAFMQVAADDLGIELEVVDCHRDRSRMMREGRALIARSPRPEYLLLVNEKSSALELLPRASAEGIHVLLINEGLMTSDAEALGKPRERFEHWIGELTPDDQRAGYLLADRLIEAARARGDLARDGRIQIGGLAGGYTTASILRVNGLRRAVQEHTDVDLVGVAPADWDEGRARELTADLLERYPRTAIVWAASDLMALGALRTAEAAGRKPGLDLLVGGVDWAPFVFEKIKDGALEASVGGHFLDGAWALVMLHDHHHGRDFGAAPATTGPALLTRDNLEDYSRFFDPREWSGIDFSRFSKALNPAVESYDFTVEAVLRYR